MKCAPYDEIEIEVDEKGVFTCEVEGVALKSTSRQALCQKIRALAPERRGFKYMQKGQEVLIRVWDSGHRCDKVVKGVLTGKKRLTYHKSIEVQVKTGEKDRKARWHAANRLMVADDFDIAKANRIARAVSKNEKELEALMDKTTHLIPREQR